MGGSPLSKTRAGDPPPPVLTKTGSHPPMPASALPPSPMESPSEEPDIRPKPGGGVGACPHHERGYPTPLSKIRVGDPLPPCLSTRGVPTPPWPHVPVLRFAWSLRLKSRLSGLYREGGWGPVPQHERGVPPPPLQNKSGGPPTPLS